jgi:DNA-binding PadR family transcriptional regulator
MCHRHEEEGHEHCHHEHEEEMIHEGCHHYKPTPIRGLAHTLILKTLKEKNASGSEIHEKITKEYEVEMPKPMIYMILRRMERMGLVTSKWETGETGPAKRIYTITEEGLDILEREMERIRRLKELAEKILK